MAAGTVERPVNDSETIPCLRSKILAVGQSSGPTVSAHLECHRNLPPIYLAPQRKALSCSHLAGADRKQWRDSRVELHLRCRCRQIELNIKQVAHHGGKDSSSQAPAATQAMPAARAIHRPTGVIFSRRTSSAKSAIQSRFITPPTNKSAIKTQQQPTQ